MVNQRWICHLAFWVDDWWLPSGSSSSGWGIVFETETSVDNDELKTAFFKDPGGNRCQIRLGGNAGWASDTAEAMIKAEMGSKARGLGRIARIPSPR